MFRRAAASRVFAASARPSRRFLSSASRSASDAWNRSSTRSRATISTALFTSAAAVYLGYQYRYGIVHAESSPVLADIVISESEILTSPVDITDGNSSSSVVEITEIIEEEVPEAPATNAEDGSESEEQPQGAFNPETGEINWDCPCLGGMASGPCGEEFKVAFSCFVFSEAEPKGVDCIEKFSAMQNCFREYPEVYAEELREEPPVEAVADHEAQASQEAGAIETPAAAQTPARA